MENTDACQAGAAGAVCNQNEMPEASVPDQPLLNLGAGDIWTQRKMSPLSNYVSYQVTTDSSAVVMEGHDQHELVKKRLTRAKLGVNKWW